MTDQSSAMKRRNGVMLAGLFGVAAGMVGLSFAAVPLYELFCQVTGFGGTTQVGEVEEIDGIDMLDRTVTVRFASNVDRALPWDFGPEIRSIDVRVGEPSIMFYTAENTGSEPVAGTAMYNVTPLKTGLYFVKVQCFCFDEQILMPGERVEMPVYFYVDPSIADDPNLDDVTEITLSYTFFETDSDQLDDAVEEYYRQIEQETSGELGDQTAMVDAGR